MAEQDRPRHRIRHLETEIGVMMEFTQVQKLFITYRLRTVIIGKALRFMDPALVCHRQWFHEQRGEKCKQ